MKATNTSNTQSGNLAHCLPDLITPQKFLEKYWQQKPLLIKQGLPQLIGMFTPEDIMGLAIEPDVSARLLIQEKILHPQDAQSHESHEQWQVKNSPLTEADFTQLADLPTSTLWTVLVQNLEQWSPELATLWQAFDFVPQWARDDIMVSYAQAGASVGQHYDNYDVFLVQGYGSRRWQLGKYCDDSTAFIANQPLRLLDDMGQIIFDEVLEAGDVLYVPPKLSHYGVAMDDCLTFSFGFRHPNPMQLLDSMTDVATAESSWFIPLHLRQQYQPEASGLLSADSIEQMESQIMSLLSSPRGKQIIHRAIAESVSQRQYPILTPEETIDATELREYLADGAKLRIDYNSRIIYFYEDDLSSESSTHNKPAKKIGRGIYTSARYSPNQASNQKSSKSPTLVMYANGSVLEGLNTKETQALKRLADGEALTAEDLFEDSSNMDNNDLSNIDHIETDNMLNSVLEWLENGWVWLDI